MFLKRKEDVSPVFALIQGGLNPNFATDILLEEVVRILKRRSILFEQIDVRESGIDFCDDRPYEQYSQQTHEMCTKMERANAYIFSIPVYAATLSGAVKNIILLSRNQMEKKPAGIMSYSAGVSPYLATHELIGLLSNASVPTVQPVVYTSREEFKDGKIFDEQISLLMEEMIDALLKRSKRWYGDED